MSLYINNSNGDHLHLLEPMYIFIEKEGGVTENFNQSKLSYIGSLFTKLAFTHTDIKLSHLHTHEY